MTTLVAIQSNYIPWKGYFDMIAAADVFVFHDDLQYTKNDWRNRNKIKTKDGLKWLTIPVGSATDRLICEVEIGDRRWRRKHLQQLSEAYARAPYRKDEWSLIEEIYDCQSPSLSDFNQRAIRLICQRLGLKTEIVDSREFSLTGSKTDRLIDLVTKATASKYLSGPAAKVYLEEEEFAAIGVELEYFSYSGYPEYSQPHGAFEHGVTILDTLFCCGPDVQKHMLFGADAPRSQA